MENHGKTGGNRWNFQEFTKELCPKEKVGLSKMMEEEKLVAKSAI